MILLFCVLQPNTLAPCSWEMWKEKEDWGWSLEKVEHSLWAVAATRESRKKKSWGWTLIPGSCPFHTVHRRSEGCPASALGQMLPVRESGENLWSPLAMLFSRGDDIIRFFKRASKKKACKLMNFLDLKLHKFFPWFWYGTLCAGWKGKLLSLELQRGKTFQIPYYLYSQLSQIIIHKSPSLSWTAHGLQGQERGGAFMAHSKLFRNLKFLKNESNERYHARQRKSNLYSAPQEQNQYTRQ